jgi:NAD(P)-dependent dehydrogenase (short-subunit alcohol dehydrogenase family)
MAQQTALIVGASRGLGLGLVREFAARGWQVTGTTRRAGALPDAGITEVPLDVRHDEQLASLANRLRPESLDLLFLNAGVKGPERQSADHVTAGELLDLMQVNAIAPVHVARQLLPAVKRGGTVAFMSSRMGSIADNVNGSCIGPARRRSIRWCAASTPGTPGHGRSRCSRCIRGGCARTWAARRRRSR